MILSQNAGSTYCTILTLSFFQSVERLKVLQIHQYMRIQSHSLYKRESILKRENDEVALFNRWQMPLHIVRT